LTTGLFDQVARTPALGGAEALRRSQLTLADTPETSHPVFWPPFVLVGDGDESAITRFFMDASMIRFGRACPS
jgi:hypothetical protein